MLPVHIMYAYYDKARNVVGDSSTTHFVRMQHYKLNRN